MEDTMTMRKFGVAAVLGAMVANKVWDTDYASGATPGSFAIYEDSSPDSPNAATVPANPPNALVPSSFSDDPPPILSGVMEYFHTQITRSNFGTFSGSFNATYHFTGGTLYGTIGGNTSNLNGLWCSLG